MNEPLLRQFLQIAAQMAVFTAVFVPLERWFTLRQEKLLRKEWLNDVGYFFLNGLLLSTLLAFPVAALTIGAQHLVPDAVFQAARDLPLWARIPLVLFVGDIGAYWGHRACHRFALLWRFHVIHHSATHIDWLVNNRAHPVELVVTRIFGLAPLFALGLAQTTVGDNAIPVLGTAFLLVWGHVIHANVRWRFGWLEYLIATPAFHHWHHTNDDKRDHNYAALFPVVDMMFGTFYLPRHFPTVYGADMQLAPALWAQLIDPLMPAAKAGSNKSQES